MGSRAAPVPRPWDHPGVDPVIIAVGVYRVAGSLLVLRWPFWGGVAAVACDLLDLLLFDIAVRVGGWPGFGDYQAFDKWVDQVYLGAFLVVALRSFAPGPRVVAAGMWLFRFIGFATFEAGLAPREALVLVPNLLEPWFIAVAFTTRYRPGFDWTTRRAAGVLAVLLVAKVIQEWALHVARAFDSTTFLGTLEAVWDVLRAR